MEKIVTGWDGHALTLSLIGAHLAGQFDGDVRRLDDLPLPLRRGPAVTAHGRNDVRLRPATLEFDNHGADDQGEIGDAPAAHADGHTIATL